jgi:hypothetical protein
LIAPKAERRDPRRPAARKPAVFWIHATCAGVILLAAAWVFVGRALHATIWELTPLYVGEVVSVWAFGVSWLLAGFAVTAPMRHGTAVLDAELTQDARTLLG